MTELTKKQIRKIVREEIIKYLKEQAIKNQILVSKKKIKSQ
jgi:hypothetical protein